MAKYKRKFRTVQILLGLLIVTIVVGIGVKTFPFLTSSSTQQIAEDKKPACATVHFVKAMRSKDGQQVRLIFRYDTPSNRDFVGGGLVGTFKAKDSKGNNLQTSEELLTLPSNDVDAKGDYINAIGDVFVQIGADGFLIEKLTITYTVNGVECQTITDTPVYPYSNSLDPVLIGSKPEVSIAPPPTTEDQPCIAPTPEYYNFDLKPCRVTEGTPIVSLLMKNVPLKEGDTKTSKYWYCLRSAPAECSGDDFRETKDSDGERKTYVIPNGATQNIRFDSLCGDGETKLKQKCNTDGSDYFHAGQTYRVTLFEKKEKGSPIVQSASFYVSHFYPAVIEPKPVKEDSSLTLKNPPQATGYTIKVKLDGRNNKSGKNSNKYNDYWVRIEGFDVEYKSQSKCIYIPKNTQEGETTINLPLVSEYSQRLIEGRYILKIKDGKQGNESTTNPNCNEGDFTYYIIPIVIGGIGKTGSIGQAIKDPNGQEGELEGARVTPLPVCPPEDMSPQGYCTSINTALGIKISTEPQFFIRDIFTIVLSIGGVAAVAFFVQAGFTLLTSAGNKEKVGAAREQITSAIMGLLFIILSITILEFVGINILHLPGFGQ